nr:hypothetical protein [Nocardia asiatica]
MRRWVSAASTSHPRHEDLLEDQHRPAGVGHPQGADEGADGAQVATNDRAGEHPPTPARHPPVAAGDRLSLHPADTTDQNRSAVAEFTGSRVKS